MSDCKRSGCPHLVRTPHVNMLSGKKLTEILSENKKSQLGKWIAPRTMSCIIREDLGLSNDKQDNALPLH